MVGTYAMVGGDELSDAERDQLLELCRQRLDAFREQRGEEVFAHRSRHRTPITGSVKVRVLTRARGRCECCGAYEHQRALEVDHIVPRNHGGSDDLSNLQALCFRCSARLGPLRFNFAKGGLSSISVGGRGASFNIPVSRSGGARTTVGLPGTGLSWSVEHAASEGLPNSRRLRQGQLDAFKQSLL